MTESIECAAGPAVSVTAQHFIIQLGHTLPPEPDRVTELEFEGVAQEPKKRKSCRRMGTWRRRRVIIWNAKRRGNQLG